ncbi:MAG: VWA domain-containing protein [Pseudomonadota bacterium]
MEKKTRTKLIYGGLVTAVALAVFTAPVITTYLNNPDDFTGRSKSNNFSNIAQNVTTPSFNLGIGKILKKEEQRTTAAELNAVEFSVGANSSDAISSRSLSAPVMESHNIDTLPDYYKDEGRDKFEDFETNPIHLVSEKPVSTFSIDVDTSSYSFVRSSLNRGVLPQKSSVRIEEMVNYFDYNYPLPETRDQPFKPTVTIVDSPWSEGKKLMHIGIKGFDIETDKPKSNLVFLIDVSGSMNNPNKLPLLVNSLKMLIDTMNQDDKISIVVYAGAAGAVLEPTSADNKAKIYAALDSLSAGGSTAGAAGINLAYQLAEQNFDENAVNRVIIATDGDFNVGITDQKELKDFVERKRESGVFLSVFGFGRGNYNDHLMQTLAQNGNGVAAYIDTLSEARKVLVEEASSTLFPIAKDVKLQVEFNPQTVSEYRLVGYETRALKREDFNNDKVDAGDIGAGHKVTAIYEFTPVGSKASTIDSLRYKNEKKLLENDDLNQEFAFLKIRYKLPKESKSNLMTISVKQTDYQGSIQTLLNSDDAISQDIAFSIAVASFAQTLKGGKYTGDMTYDNIINIARKSKGDDEFGYRSEFVQLVRLAKTARAM